MTRSKQEEAIANILAARTSTNACDWYLVFKARHGMQIAFEEIRAELDSGDVATQLLTCCTAVDPILVAGLIRAIARLTLIPPWLVQNTWTALLICALLWPSIPMAWWTTLQPSVWLRALTKRVHF